MTRVLKLVTTDGPFYSQQVRALEERGVDCTTVSVPRSGADGSRSPRDYLAFYREVLRTARGGEFDLVHANYGLVAPFALAQPVRPMVLSLWGSDLLGRIAPVSRACARRADAVIVMSEEMARELGSDARIIPYGIDMDRFRPMPAEEAREAVGWAHDRKHVLFPYDPDRDVKDYPRAERVVERAREDVDGRVELQTVYGVPHERVPTYMNAADVLLMTSKHEGSPNTVKEALACDLPVVTTDVGDVRKWLGDVDAAAVCRTDGELRDALVRVLEGAEPADGREAVRPSSLERSTDRLLDVYEDVLR